MYVYVVFYLQATFRVQLAKFEMRVKNSLLFTTKMLRFISSEEPSCLRGVIFYDIYLLFGELVSSASSMDGIG